jgi:hypothetical protein
VKEFSMLKKMLHVATACLLVTAATVLPQTAAEAVTAWMPINADMSNKCMDDPGNSLAHVQIDIWTCISVAGGYQSNEQWRFEEAGPGSGYWIRNQKSNLCLTVLNNRTDNNAPVIQYPCNTGANERWYVNKNYIYAPIGDSTIYFYLNGIYNAGSGKYLTVQNNGVANGSKLIQYEGNGGRNQGWDFAWS